MLDRIPAMGNAESGAGFVRVLTCTLKGCLVPQHTGHLATVCFTIPTSSVRPHDVHGAGMFTHLVLMLQCHIRTCVLLDVWESCTVLSIVASDGLPMSFANRKSRSRSQQCDVLVVSRIISDGNMLSNLPLGESLMSIEHHLTHLVTCRA